MKRKIYVVHVCKNRKCNRAWLDEDLTNAKDRPPRWKYCPECCEKYGFVNPEFPPKKELSQKQLEVIEKNKFVTRKKTVISNENNKGDICLQVTP